MSDSIVNKKIQDREMTWPVSQYWPVKLVLASYDRNGQYIEYRPVLKLLASQVSQTSTQCEISLQIFRSQKTCQMNWNSILEKTVLEI